MWHYSYMHTTYNIHNVLWSHQLLAPLVYSQYSRKWSRIINMSLHSRPLLCIPPFATILTEPANISIDNSCIYPQTRRIMTMTCFPFDRFISYSQPHQRLYYRSLDPDQVHHNFIPQYTVKFIFHPSEMLPS